METSTTSYDAATFLFPNFENSTRMKFYEFVNFLDVAAHPILDIQLYVSIFGVVITVFHLFILTRRSMLTSSVMSIMIGIAISDWISMITLIESNNKFLDTKGDACRPSLSLFYLQTYWISLIVRDLFRRVSTWLGLLMALFRYLVLRFVTSSGFQTLSEPRFGFFTVIGAFMLSCCFSIFYYFRYEIYQEGTWMPMKNCTSVDLSTSLPVYGQKHSFLFAYNSGIVGKVYMFLNGVSSKILPCIFLPILTLLLIVELKRTEKIRQAKNFSKASSSGTERTTALVIFMAVLFFIVELPIGITVALQVSYTDVGYWWLATYVQHFCNTVFAISASLHCVICFLMSSQYRKTFGKIFQRQVTFLYYKFEETKIFAEDYIGGEFSSVKSKLAKQYI
ncbi:hypothetical protein CRE_18710 [Caenorhabditis remanei]|uniref:G-protein coupled receptors family 1 profile domain-containing protein n=1 Tax=Caenorhabditis remanei TaxID=31234 RepID=E3LLF9_CAERE|nr:hypothetical protein CRE_18710 [Caenorhabditis remanei]